MIKGFEVADNESDIKNAKFKMADSDLYPKLTTPLDRFCPMQIHFVLYNSTIYRKLLIKNTIIINKKNVVAKIEYQYFSAQIIVLS